MRSEDPETESPKDLFTQQLKRWRQLWVYTACMLVAVLMAGGIGVSVLIDGNHSLKDQVETLQAVSESNNRILDRLNSNQAGIDELVSFVRDIQQRQTEESSTQMFIDLLCASTDPVRQAACRELRGQS